MASVSADRMIPAKRGVLAEFREAIRASAVPGW